LVATAISAGDRKGRPYEKSTPDIGCGCVGVGRLCDFACVVFCFHLLSVLMFGFIPEGTLRQNKISTGVHILIYQPPPGGSGSGGGGGGGGGGLITISLPIFQAISRRFAASFVPLKCEKTSRNRS